MLAEFKCLHTGRIHRSHRRDNATSGGNGYSNNNDTDGNEYNIYIGGRRIRTTNTETTNGDVEKGSIFTKCTSVSLLKEKYNNDHDCNDTDKDGDMCSKFFFLL